MFRHRCRGELESPTSVLTSSFRSNVASTVGQDDRGKTAGQYVLKYDELEKKTIISRENIPWTNENWIFVDRNSKCLTVKEREGRISFIKELMNELFSLLDTKRDVTVFRAENNPTSLFPAMPLPTAIARLLDSSFIPDMSDATMDGASDNRVKRVTSCIKDTCRLFELICYAVRNRVVLCMSDGFGSSAGFLASFAAACNEESPLTLIIYLGTMEASVYTKGYPGVQSTSEWKESRGRGGHLIAWTENHTWLKLSSTEMQGMFAKTNQTPFDLGLRNILKQLQDNKMRGPSWFGNLLPQQNRDAQDIAAVLQYDAAHGDIARELMVACASKLSMA